MKEPGSLLAAGRDADIFEYGPGLVLRRARDGRSIAHEALTMEYLRAEGYPVPAVEEVSEDGCDIVMERIDGPSMVAALGRAPWSVRRQGALLADLHRRLHEIIAPEFLPAAPVGEGDKLLHLDLHPLNVILGANGPVVIDWTNAACGDPDFDVGLAWVLMSAGTIPGDRVTAALLSAGRALLVRGFLSRVDKARVAAKLREVVSWKVHDPNMSAREVAAMWRTVERAGSGSGAR